MPSVSSQDPGGMGQTSERGFLEGYWGWGMVEPPELPEDLKHWITYNEVSSRLLRAECGLSEDIKDQ
ncbi:hypothetical protein H920_11791 [Fukomys damarensis]|uniref:Uncharacterized protein n=1 Tax=Fukomys damarensis TaxID=885580 RepID=A0A091DVJ3_FUKDA|nr:hypothetical protein H920_11791 [Fukomys damarensis]